MSELHFDDHELTSGPSGIDDLFGEVYEYIPHDDQEQNDKKKENKKDFHSDISNDTSIFEQILPPPKNNEKEPKKSNNIPEIQERITQTEILKSPKVTKKNLNPLNSTKKKFVNTTIPQPTQKNLFSEKIPNPFVQKIQTPQNLTTTQTPMKITQPFGINSLNFVDKTSSLKIPPKHAFLSPKRDLNEKPNEKEKTLFKETPERKKMILKRLVPSLPHPPIPNINKVLMEGSEYKKPIEIGMEEVISKPEIKSAITEKKGEGYDPSTLEPKLKNIDPPTIEKSQPIVENSEKKPFYGLPVYIPRKKSIEEQNSTHLPITSLPKQGLSESKKPVENPKETKQLPEKILEKKPIRETQGKNQVEKVIPSAVPTLKNKVKKKLVEELQEIIIPKPSIEIEQNLGKVEEKNKGKEVKKSQPIEVIDVDEENVEEKNTEKKQEIKEKAPILEKDNKQVNIEHKEENKQVREEKEETEDEPTERNVERKERKPIVKGKVGHSSHSEMLKIVPYHSVVNDSNNSEQTPLTTSERIIKRKRSLEESLKKKSTEAPLQITFSLQDNEPPKKKRGRPFGTKNKPKSEEEKLKAKKNRKIKKNKETSQETKEVIAGTPDLLTNKTKENGKDKDKVKRKVEKETKNDHIVEETPQKKQKITETDVKEFHLPSEKELEEEIKKTEDKHNDQTDINFKTPKSRRKSVPKKLIQSFQSPIVQDRALFIEPETISLCSICKIEKSKMEHKSPIGSLSICSKCKNKKVDISQNDVDHIKELDPETHKIIEDYQYQGRVGNFYSATSNGKMVCTSRFMITVHEMPSGEEIFKDRISRQVLFMSVLDESAYLSTKDQIHEYNFE